MPLDGAQLRQVMRRWATGVSVVTSRADGVAHGITVNSFTSLSLDPALCLICIDRNARAHDAIAAAGGFTVNLLAAAQQDVSQRFAGRRPDLADPFEGLALEAAPSGAPVFAGCLGFLDCKLHGQVAGGDHTIYIGLVMHASVGIGDGPPLLFYGGRYRSLDAVEA